MTSNIKKLRTDFPVFTTKPDWAYLDTSATSHMPQSVMDAMAEYHCAYRAPVHRGMYKEAVRATEAYEGARARVAKFIDAQPEEVIFTSGATGSSNMLAYALEQSIDWVAGDEIVTTVMEHHSALIPLQELAKRKKLVLKSIPLNKTYALDYNKAETLITNRTKLVSVVLASNVLGTVNDVARISELARAVGALLISDATAAAGHLPLSAQKLGVDFLYFSGHKMCGPSGIGVLWGAKQKLDWLCPGFFGGGMVEEVTPLSATWATVPHKFEPGTPNIAGAIGLGAAVEYLTDHRVADIRTYVEALVTVAQAALKKIPGVRVFSAKPSKNVGVVSFTVDGVHSHDIAEIAARQGVALRAGHHCALPLHDALGVNATVRASFYLYNTKQDVDALVHSIAEAQRIFGVLPKRHKK